jgi:hypothetical protein
MMVGGGLHRLNQCRKMEPCFLGACCMMKTRVIGMVIGVAAALAAMGAGGGMAPGAKTNGPSVTSRAATTRAIPGKTDQMRGFSMRLADPSEQGVNSCLAAIDDLADMGCTWINLPVSAYQETARSESISLEKGDAPSEADILRIMARAKTRGMGIMMMPTVLLRHPGTKEWRGVINPPNWDNWFASYRKFITSMAILAQQGNADIFVVGSELLSTESYRERWIETIDVIKNEFNGKLTYSANWDHYTAVTFWDQLDYVGMNNYYELSKKEGATVEELNQAWGPIQKNILAFAARQKKPFLFTEVGWHNLANTLKEPWNYVAKGDINLKEQERAYESFVGTWSRVPKERFMGAFIWEWDPKLKVVNGVFPHGAYSLQGTPALEVVKKWFAMPQGGGS